VLAACLRRKPSRASGHPLSLARSFAMIHRCRRGESGRPSPVDEPHAQLIRDRGDVREQEQLGRLSLGCGGDIDLSTGDIPLTREALETAAAQTAQAMRHGTPLI
jgi:hypothetical protein